MVRPQSAVFFFEEDSSIPEHSKPLMWKSCWASGYTEITAAGFRRPRICFATYAFAKPNHYSHKKRQASDKACRFFVTGAQLRNISNTRKFYCRQMTPQAIFVPALPAG